MSKKNRGVKPLDVLTGTILVTLVGSAVAADRPRLQSGLQSTIAQRRPGNTD